MSLLTGDRKPIPYPPEEHLVATLTEIGRLRDELERLNDIIA